MDIETENTMQKMSEQASAVSLIRNLAV